MNALVWITNAYTTNGFIDIVGDIHLSDIYDYPENIIVQWWLFGFQSPTS